MNSVMEFASRFRDERRVVSWNRHRTLTVDPNVPEAEMPQYFRPNRPLIGVLYDPTEQSAGAFVSNWTSRLLSEELAHVFGQPRLQFGYRIHLLPVVPPSTVSQWNKTVYPAVSVPLYNGAHPLHKLWHRYQALVAVGSSGGIAFRALSDWSSPSSAVMLGGISAMERNLLPRSVVICSSEPCSEYARSTADNVDLVVLPPIVSSTRVKQMPVSQVSISSTAGRFHHGVAQLGVISIVHEVPAQARAVELRRILDGVVYGPHANAHVELQQPIEGSWIALDFSSGNEQAFDIRTRTTNFVIPDNGAWQLAVNGTEVRQCSL